MRELYQLWPSALSSEQTDAISHAALGQPKETPTIFAPTEGIQEIRSCSIRWISDSWIQDLLWQYVLQANDRGFQVDVNKRSEMQFTEYESRQGAHYDWHHDVNWNGQTAADRKLSVTVQLTHGHEYEGGDFEFEELQTNADFRSKGTVLVFPSYLRHRIRPVTAGTRHALVAWFYGPRWT